MSIAEFFGANFRRTQRTGKALRNANRRQAGCFEPLEERMLLTAVPTPTKVVVVIEENHAYNSIIGSANAPYINSLASGGASMTNSHGVTHPSQPNYIELFSGSNQGITTDSAPSTARTAANLASQLVGVGYSFSNYSESMPSDGYSTLNSGSPPNVYPSSSQPDYAQKHNPAAIFSNLGAGTPGTNATYNKIFDSSHFPTTGGTDYSFLPTVSWVVPNQVHDMHGYSGDGLTDAQLIQNGDTWLQNNLSSYISWAQTHNSLLIVTWDEDDSASGNQVATIFYGPMVQTGQYSENINHYNVLRTVEDMYGLSYLGNAATATSITDIWAAQPTVQFTAASQNVGEAAGTFTITAQLSAASGSNVSIPFTVSGTASGSGVDYSMTTTSPLVITAGNTSGSITGTITDDSIYDPGETIIVTMGTPTNATLGSPSAHTITIVDNDSPISLGGAAAGQDVNDNQTIAAFSSFTVSDTSNPSASLTVQVSLDNSAKGVFTPASLSSSGFTLQSPGVYQFVGNAAASQTAIRALVYDPTDNRVAVGSTETTTFTVTATDGSNPSASNNGTTVVSHSVNELPIVDLNGGAGGTGYSNTYTMGGTAASVGDPSNLTVSDSDNTTLASASVSIGSPNAGDQLAANTGGTSITASYSSGILSLSGSDTLAHYQQVLRSVVYSHTPAGPPQPSRTISVLVNDGLNNSATATSSMTVQFLLGDTNGDGNVDLTDYNNVQNHFGQLGNPVIGDTNGDGVVDLADYNNVQNHFGQHAAAMVAAPADTTPAVTPAAAPAATSDASNSGDAGNAVAAVLVAPAVTSPSSQSGGGSCQSGSDGNRASATWSHDGSSADTSQWAPAVPHVLHHVTDGNNGIDDDLLNLLAGKKRSR